MAQTQIKFASYSRVQRILESNANFKKLLTSKKFPVDGGKRDTFPAAVIHVVRALAQKGTDPSKAAANLIMRFAAEQLFKFSTAANGELVMTPIDIKVPELAATPPKEKARPKEKVQKAQKAQKIPKPAPKAKKKQRVKLFTGILRERKPKPTVQIVAKPPAKSKPVKAQTKQARPVAKVPKPAAKPPVKPPKVARKRPAPVLTKSRVAAALPDNGDHPMVASANALPPNARPMPVESDKALDSIDPRVQQMFCVSISITNLLVSILQLSELDKDPGHDSRRARLNALLDEYAAIHQQFIVHKGNSSLADSPAADPVATPAEIPAETPVLPAPVLGDQRTNADTDTVNEPNQETEQRR